MSKVDWSKAPEWAEAHGLVHGVTTRDVWFNEKVYMYVGDTRSYPWANGSPGVGYNHSRNSVTHIELRQKPWIGEGLPPVGTVCELHMLGGDFRVVEILGYSEDESWIRYVEPNRATNSFILVNAEGFRPILTPEQVAAEDREHRLRNACTDISKALDGLHESEEPTAVSIIEAMIDAGYRKQEAAQ